MAFIEADLENLILNLLKNKQYNYVHGEEIEKQNEDVLIEEDIKDFLYNKYKENDITEEEVRNIILSIKSISNADLYNSNKTTFLKIVEGENYTRLDRSKKIFIYNYLILNILKIIFSRFVIKL